MDISEEIRNELESLADTKYREFHASLLPGTDNVLGVRIPQLRAMAKRIIKRDDWRSFAEADDTLYYEERMLQGMVIGMAKMDFIERMERVRRFIPHIDNWAVCDIFCGELKTLVRKGKEEVWKFIQPYLRSDKEFEVRYGIVMLFHYIDEEHIGEILAYADHFSHEAYYARMAMAWVLSICFVKFPAETMEYLKRSQLDNWTYNKTLQKITESLRVDKETKQVIRGMKRKDIRRAE